VQEWREAAGQLDGTRRESVGTDRGDDAPEYGHRGDSGRNRRHRGAGKCIGTAAGQPDHAEALGAEGVGDMGDVCRPVGHRFVGVWVGQAGTRAADHDDAQAESFCCATAEQWELAPATGCAVEPQHRGTRRIAELREAEAAAGGQVEAALGAWLLDPGYTNGVPYQVGHSD
jgi:hypothetical protein